jgi:hypothetical protein
MSDMGKGDDAEQIYRKSIDFMGTGCVLGVRVCARAELLILDC